MSKQPAIMVMCWVSPSGRKQVKDWIADLDDAAFKKVDKLIGLLKSLGRDLRPPHCRFLGDGLYELRDTATGPGYRIYYTWEDNMLVILLAAGDKGSQVKDIEIARRRLKDEE